MKITRFLPLIAIFSTSAALLAQDPDKGRAKAEGSGEAAEKVIRKGEGAPQKPEHDKTAAFRREVEELHKAGKHEDAERLAKKVSGGAPGGSHAEGPERLHHLLQAIEHLRAAGLNEPAASLENVAREMKEQLGRGGALSEPGGKPHPGAPSDAGDVRAQLQKLAHSVEELRAQLQALRGEGGKKMEFDAAKSGKGGKVEMKTEGTEKGGKAEKKGEGPEKKFDKTETGERAEKFEKNAEKPAGSEKGAKDEGAEKGGKVFQKDGGAGGPEKGEKK